MNERIHMQNYTYSMILLRWYSRRIIFSLLFLWITFIYNVRNQTKIAWVKSRKLGLVTYWK